MGQHGSGGDEDVGRLGVHLRLTCRTRGGGCWCEKGILWFYCSLAAGPTAEAGCVYPQCGPSEGPLRLLLQLTGFSPLQGYEDWLRHKADNAMNQCPVHFIQHGKLVRKQSRRLRVSNTVLLPPKLGTVRTQKASV